MRIWAVCVSVFFLVSCTTANTVTGREQFIIIPASQDAALGLEAMNEVKKTTSVLITGLKVERVKLLGQAIAKVSDKPNLDWEFIVIDEPQLNAWALPGGKIAVYAKMLDQITEDKELAAVIGHEIAHAVLRHGAEQLSRAQAQNAAITGIGAIVGTTTGNNETAEMAIQLGSMAAQGFVQLPHSRAMELEADHVGAVYMARAGFDPREAVNLWRRMAKLKGPNGGPPVFLSTHPTDVKRIKKLEENMHQYLAIYDRYN